MRSLCQSCFGILHSGIEGRVSLLALYRAMIPVASEGFLPF